MKMTRKNLSAAAAAACLAAASWSAHAMPGGDEAYGEEAFPVWTSTLTRAEVMADLASERAGGRMDPGGEFSTPDSVLVAREHYAQAQERERLAQLEAEQQRLLLAQAAAADTVMPADADGDASPASMQAAVPPDAGMPASTAQQPMMVMDQPATTEAAAQTTLAADGSPQPDPMPQLRPVPDTAVDRRVATYLELDDNGAVVPLEADALDTLHPAGAMADATVADQPADQPFAQP